MLWSKGKRYEGLCTHYDPNDGKHFVVYDDGEKKWYTMTQKTFWVIGDEGNIKYEPTRVVGAAKTAKAAARTNKGGRSTTHATAGRTTYTNTAYTRQWTPYISKTANANTVATFNVLVDPRAMQGGERIIVVGNLEQMGGWNEGVQLVPHPRNPLIWSVTLEMPFTVADSCIHGMFQFRYKIVSNDGESIQYVRHTTTDTAIATATAGTPRRRHTRRRRHHHHPSPPVTLVISAITAPTLTLTPG